MGILWTIIIPVMTVIIFGFLVSRRVLPVGDTHLPYILFALCNITVWQLFSSTLSASTQSLANAGPMVTKINFPKESIVISTAVQPIMDFIIRLFVIIPVFIYFSTVPSWQSIFIPLLLIPLVMLAIGFGFCFSVLNLVINDISYGLNILLSFAIFFAPVFYPPPEDWPFYLINIINPASPFLIGIQDLIVYGRFNQPLLVYLAIFLAFLLFFIGWYLFNIAIPRVTERA